MGLRRTHRIHERAERDYGGALHGVEADRHNGPSAFTPAPPVCHASRVESPPHPHA